MVDLSRELDRLMLPRNPEARVRRIEQLIAASKELERLREALGRIANWDDSVEAEDCPGLRGIAHDALWLEGPTQEEMRRLWFPLDMQFGLTPEEVALVIDGLSLSIPALAGDDRVAARALLRRFQEALAANTRPEGAK